MTAYQGYGVRCGVVQYCAADEKSWYGLQVTGFGETSAIQVEWQPSYGFAARPRDHDGSDGCQAFYSAQGKFGWTGHDPRYNDKAPPFSKGSSAQWIGNGAFVLQDFDLETTTIYQPVLNGTKAHKILIGVDGAGEPTIDILHSSKAHLTFADAITTWRHSGDGFITIAGNEIVLNGTVNTSASFTVGGAGAQPLTNATALAGTLHLLAASVGAEGTLPITAAALGVVIEAIAVAVETVAATQMIRGV